MPDFIFDQLMSYNENFCKVSTEKTGRSSIIIHFEIIAHKIILESSKKGRSKRLNDDGDRENKQLVPNFHMPLKIRTPKNYLCRTLKVFRPDDLRLVNSLIIVQEERSIIQTTPPYYFLEVPLFGVHGKLSL